MATAVLPELIYPESDGQPMAETQIHGNTSFDVYSRLTARYAAADDGYVGMNMFIYWVERQPHKVLAPDVFVAFGVPNEVRRTYKTWDEGGVFPSVVFEFTSESSRREDMGTKFATYCDDWRVSEYFLFDPLEEYLDPSLLGYRRTRKGFDVIKPTKGKLVSKTLGVTLERDGTMLLMRDATTGKPLLLPAEQQAEDAERKAEEAERKVDRTVRKVVRLIAATDQLLAARDAERAAREAAEAEVAKLKAELAALRKGT